MYIYTKYSKTKLPFNRRRTTRECVYLVTLVCLVIALLTLTLTDYLAIRTWPRCSTEVPASKNEVLGQGFRELEHEQDRHAQTDRQTQRRDRMHSRVVG